MYVKLFFTPRHPSHGQDIPAVRWAVRGVSRWNSTASSRQYLGQPSIPHSFSLLRPVLNPSILSVWCEEGIKQSLVTPHHCGTEEVMSKAILLASLVCGHLSLGWSFWKQFSVGGLATLFNALSFITIVFFKGKSSHIPTLYCHPHLELWSRCDTI